MGRRMMALACAMTALLSCSNALAPGQPCFASEECGAAQCIRTSTGRQCMLPCTVDDILCDADEACVAADTNADAGVEPLFVCLPGGDVPIGSGCVESVDCEVGAICVENGGDSSCALVCSVSRGTPCGAAEQCTALDGDRGFCEETP